MATVPYLLELPSPTAMPARTLRNGVSSYAVNAESAADASALVKALYADQVGAMIDQSTVTRVAAAANLSGWNFRVQIHGAFNPTTGLTPVVFDQTVTADGAAQTITAAIAASGTLTLDNGANNVADGETVTVGGKVYTFQASLTNVNGNVKIGASGAASLTNLFHAINASGGTVGTDYATAMTANVNVIATNPSGTTVVATAIVAGAAGNAIASTETSTHLSWGAATLASGADAITSTDKLSSLALKMVTALNADAAIASAAWNNGTHVLTVAGTGDTLGDHRVVAAITSPTASSTLSNTIPGFISAKVDGGIAAAALTLTLAADTYTVPTVVALLGEQVSE